MQPQTANDAFPFRLTISQRIDKWEALKTYGIVVDEIAFLALAMSRPSYWEAVFPAFDYTPAQMIYLRDCWRSDPDSPTFADEAQAYSKFIWNMAYAPQEGLQCNPIDDILDALLCMLEHHIEHLVVCWLLGKPEYALFPVNEKLTQAFLERACNNENRGFSSWVADRWLPSQLRHYYHII